MKAIKGFEFVKTDREVYYFNYLSKANQIYEITVCQECESQILTPIEEGEDCPSCGEEYLPYDKGTYDFFDTGQNDDAVAGFAFDFHNINGQRAVISIQGIIDFDNETVQMVRYKNGEPALQGVEDFTSNEIQGWVEILEVKQRLDLFTDEWNIDWEINQILDNELEEVN